VKPESDPTLVDKIAPDRRPLVEMRAFLRYKDRGLTETWTCGAQL
jgi:hypothetical protein